jgi:KDO2-lipid IV(A) lauroyltransferase
LKKFTRLLLNIFLKVVQIVPATVSFWVTKLILVLVGYRKQVINKNYINTTVNKYYASGFSNFYKSNIQFVARVIIESISSVSDKNLERLQFSNISKLESQCKESNGVILLASHYGNWELACTILPKHTELACYGVYKPLKNKVVDQFMLDKRSKQGLHLIPMNKIGRTILENKNKGISAVYILIADQNPNSKNSIVWSQFLGIKTAFFNGPMKLVQKYGFNVAYMEVEVGNRLFEYNININTDLFVGDNSKDLVDSYSDILESQIQKAPQYWLWSHKRWKRTF